MVALRHGPKVTQRGTSDSLEERVRQTLKGLHWAGRFCQVREIQQMQARGGSRLMAVAADGRDGWSVRRGGLTIDVTQGWTDDGAFGWSWLGGRGSGTGRPFSPPWGKGLRGCGAAGWVSQPGSATHPAWPVCLGAFVCVSVCTCVFVHTHTLICSCQCAPTTAELCVFRTLGVCLCVPLCVWGHMLTHKVLRTLLVRPCAPLCPRVCVY